MAFDEELAGRIRAALSFQARVKERHMFGGCAFLLDGHLARRSERTWRFDAQG